MPDQKQIDRPPAPNPHPASNHSLDMGAQPPGEDWFCLSWLDRSESMSSSRRATSERPTLPGYEIMRELGQGDTGVVYLARDPKLKRRVAIKLLRAGSVVGDAHKQLRHPNIVHVQEAGEHQGRHFLVLEYVAGPNLHQFLDGKPLLPRTAAELLESIARGVQHAHEQGLVHQNLKPTNILLSSDEGEVGPGEESEPAAWRSVFRTPKITDFGVVGPRPSSEDLVAARHWEITPSYMSPERINPSGRVGAEADVYSLGAMLYEMLTGCPPFNAADAAETLRLVRDCDPLPPRQLQSNLPRDLETICLNCLRKDPKQRYAGPAELGDDLRRFLEGRTIAARPPNPISRAAQWARQKPVRASLTAVAAVVILVLVAGTAMVASAHRHEKDSRRRAEQSRDGALAAADEMLEQIARNPRLHKPDLNDLRRNLMAKAVPHYLKFLRLTQGDPTQDAQRARVLAKLGFIRLELGELKQAVDDFAAAGEIYESLLANSPGQIEFQRRLAVASLRRGKALIQLSRLEEGKSELLRSQRLLDGLSDNPEWTDEDSTNLKDCESQLKRMNAETKPDR